MISGEEGKRGRSVVRSRRERCQHALAKMNIGAPASDGEDGWGGVGQEGGGGMLEEGPLSLS